MSSLDRFMECVTALVFLCVGLGQISSYRRRAKALGAEQMRLPFGLPSEAIIAVGLLEIVAALALVVPFGPWPPAIRVPLAALALALLTVIAGVDHLRRHASLAPAAVLLLLTMFVLVGRWEQLPDLFHF